MADPKERFTNRVTHYVKYRPGYPYEIYDYLNEKIDLNPSWEVADIGSGTGISSKLYLDHGHFVYGIEPNQAMHNASLRYLMAYSNFSGIIASAEDTELEDDSIDLINCGQAFHWFNHRAAKTEFRRILKTGGYLVLMWNSRARDTPFGQAYEQLIQQYSIDYKDVRHSKLDDGDFSDFYGHDDWQYKQFNNYQELDFDGLKGRLQSSSYIPTEQNADFVYMMNDLKELYDDYKTNDTVRLEYNTEVYFGQLS